MKKKKDAGETAEQTRKQLMKNGYNADFLRSVRPAGGLSFKNEKFIKTGDGYEVCIHVYKYPKLLNPHWLSNTLNIPGAVTVLDIGTENANDVIRNINRAIHEQNSRERMAKERTERKDAQQRIAELDNLYDEVTLLEEIVKVITIRIFIAAGTLAEADKQAQAVMQKLNASGYKCAVFLNETRNEWISQFIPYTEQLKTPYKRYGQPLQAMSLAGGDPFNYISLNDPLGSYLGQTTTSGSSVIFDLFHKDKKRKSYNFLAFGTMGSGKSTLLKKLMEDMAVRGNYARVIDATGEFSSLTNHLGGVIINLAEGGLNVLQIFKADEKETACFSIHISKLRAYYKFLSPRATDRELSEFTLQLKCFYEVWGFQDPSHYTDHPAEEYPLWSDFLNYLDKKLHEETTEKDEVQLKLKMERLLLIQDIHRVISNLVNNYGHMVNCHTTIENLLDEPIVAFNIKNLAKMSDDIFDAQMFNALFLAWDNAVHIGSKMKNLYEADEIEWEDITRFLLIIDEAHKTVNASKLEAVKQINVFAREARKYFSGIGLASQNISDYIPDGSSQEGVVELKKLFAMTQYKFIMQQDSSAISLMENVFESQITPTEIRRIPKFEMGQALLSISGHKNIEIQIAITDYEKQLFQGGA